MLSAAAQTFRGTFSAFESGNMAAEARAGVVADVTRIELSYWSALHERAVLTLRNGCHALDYDSENYFCAGSHSRGSNMG